MVKVRQLRAGDVWAVLANLRQADLDEITALVGEDGVFDAVTTSARCSARAWSLVNDEEVLAVFGVAPADLTDPVVGMPWMVGTDGVARHRRAFMRLCKVYIPRMLECYPRLVNLVDARNSRAIAWLKHAGFTFAPPVAAGLAGEPFYPFVMEAVSCA